MTVRITINAREGAFHRDETGLERIDVSSYGDPQSNAESMAFTPPRSVSRPRLVSPGSGPFRAGPSPLRRRRLRALGEAIPGVRPARTAYGLRHKA